MPHSRPCFVKIVIQHYYPFLKYNPHLSDKVIRQAKIKRRFKERERRIRLEVADELEAIVDESPYFVSKYIA